MRYRAALVTGASSGIGRELSLELARIGTPLVALLARRERELEEVAGEVRALGATPIVIAADVADTEALVVRIRALDREVDGLDLVVANAGVGASANADPIAWETLRDPFHVNVCGAVATLTAALGSMVRRKRGHLVGIGSISAYGALPGSAAYCAPKAGLKMLLDCLRLDVASSGVGVTHVRLGFVRTRMVEHTTHPMPQIMEAADAARRIARRLPKMPREIVLPRTLALVAQLAAAAPESLRERCARSLDRV